jgi:tyrosyl-tRNA synthetase
LLLSFSLWMLKNRCDRVKNRLNSSEGMSFAEFCYPLMQAWDWWVLFRKGVQVQVGGSDQYGNILFGMECVKQASRNTALQEEKNLLTNELDRPLGITTPLLTAPNGEKIGKSGGNGIWLDQEMTPTFELYQVSCPLVLKTRNAS